MYIIDAREGLNYVPTITDLSASYTPDLGTVSVPGIGHGIVGRMCSNLVAVISTCAAIKDLNQP